MGQRLKGQREAKHTPCLLQALELGFRRREFWYQGNMLVIDDAGLALEIYVRMPDSKVVRSHQRSFAAPPTSHATRSRTPIS